jgi:hypothetical protein
VSNPLIQTINQRLADESFRVLVQAAENVGECTYAKHIGPYCSARKRLYQHQGGWRSMQRMMAISEESRLTDICEYHHREMYRQPCLICGWCKTRSKWWSRSAFTMFGENRFPEADEFAYIPSSGLKPPYFVSDASGR